MGYRAYLPMECEGERHQEGRHIRRLRGGAGYGGRSPILEPQMSCTDDRCIAVTDGAMFPLARSGPGGVTPCGLAVVSRGLHLALPLR